MQSKKINSIIIFGYIIILISFCSSKALAEDFSIPHQFNSGDVLSANVLNEIFSSIRNVKRSIVESDLLGTWNCESVSKTLGGGYTPVSGWVSDSTGLIITLDSTITFSLEGTTYNMSTTSPSPFDPLTEEATNSPYVVRANWIYFNWLPDYPMNFGIESISDTRLIFYYGPNASVGFATLECDKQNLPPSSPTELTASLSNSTATLTWSDNSSDETGFSILRKDSLTGDYVEIGTASANATTYTDTLTSNGTYWYRVLATNTNGNSVGSNVVKVTKE